MVPELYIAVSGETVGKNGKKIGRPFKGSKNKQIKDNSGKEDKVMQKRSIFRTLKKNVTWH